MEQYEVDEFKNECSKNAKILHEVGEQTEDHLRRLHEAQEIFAKVSEGYKRVAEMHRKYKEENKKREEN